MDNIDQGACATVLIETPAGPTRINATDYDEKKHKLVGGKKADANTADDDNRVTAQTGAPLAPTPTGGIVPNPPAYQVISEGTGKAKKAYVIHPTGARVENAPGIDPAGYPDEGKAWEAIFATMPNAIQPNSAS